MDKFYKTFSTKALRQEAEHLRNSGVPLDVTCVLFFGMEYKERPPAWMMRVQRYMRCPTCGFGRFLSRLRREAGSELQVFGLWWPK